MEPRTLQELAAACGGELLAAGPVTTVTRVVTDSRSAGPGDLFVALKGDRFDGHDFIPEVTGRRVAALMVSRGRRAVDSAGIPLLVVEDPRAALGQIAGAYRREFDLPVVCVGGSNGKTTTKELIASVLSASGPILKSEASWNNDVGVPQTLLRLKSAHRVAVLEAGTNHPGELAPLVRLIAPRIGVISSLGREHLEFFGDFNGVVAEEGWLAELLPSEEQGGVLIVHGDSPRMDEVVARTRARVVSVGFGRANDWTARIRAMDWSGTTFGVQSPDPEWSWEYTMLLPGRHSVPNALLALAVARELGVEPTAARDGLAAFHAAPGRLQLRAAGGVQVLDDTYNANADSMLAALQTLSDLPCVGRRVAVLGDMAELGSHAETSHAEVGRAAARLGINAVFTVGRCAAITAGAAGQGLGHAFSNLDEAAEAVRRYLQADDAVLVKASRSARLERLVEMLILHLEQRDDPLVAEPS